MIIPLPFLRLLPRRAVEWYADYLYARGEALLSRVHTAALLLEGIEPGYEYTEGYRQHLMRKTDEWNAEFNAIVGAIATIEDALLSGPS